MLYKKIVVGPLQCNAAIVACEKSKDAILIDPGDEGARITAEVEALGLKVKFILHTHAHFDHIGASSHVKKALNAPLCLHRGDELLFKNLPIQGKLYGFKFGEAPNIDQFIEDNEIITFGDCKLEVIHTPGHSPGSICFKISGSSDEIVFSGDTLFQSSIGRTDLWGGDHRQILKSIKERLFILDDDLEVHPGHGPSTSIGIEKRNNPFIK